MVDLIQAIAISASIGVIPVILGMSLPMLIRSHLRNSTWILSSFAIGIILAEYVDLTINASQLGVSIGFARGGITQALLVGSFAIAIIGLPALDRIVTKGSTGVNMWVIYLISIGLGFHSLAEGIVIGYDLNVSGISLNIGSLTQALSFIIHKFAEGFIIPILFLSRLSWRDIIIPGSIASLPILLGTALGLFGLPGIMSSVFFAMGAGGSIYMLLRFVPMILPSKNILYSSLVIFIGFFFVYVAGLIHSI